MKRPPPVAARAAKRYGHTPWKVRRVYKDMERPGDHRGHIDIPSWQFREPRPNIPTEKTAEWVKVFKENCMILAWQLPALTYWQHAEVKWSFMEVGFSYDIAHKRDLHPFLLKSKYRNFTRPLQGVCALTYSNDYNVKLAVKCSKLRPNIELVGGVIDDTLMTRNEILALSKIKNKEQLHPELVGILSAPAFLLSSYLQKHVDGSQAT